MVMPAIPSTSLYSVKRRMARHLGAKVGEGTQIVSSARLISPGIVLGDHAFIGHGVLIVGGPGSSITIGRRAALGPRVLLAAGSHDIGPTEQRAGGGRSHHIVIGDGAWVGAGATVVGPVTIGAGAVIAAGAVVVDDVPPDSLAAGVPARVIKTLDRR
jgi:acetyltransferase-like isoleucine patch superfamily enzyme